MLIDILWILCAVCLARVLFTNVFLRKSEKNCVLSAERLKIRIFCNFFKDFSMDRKTICQFGFTFEGHLSMMEKMEL
jgi:hypothetical protein